MNSDTVTSVGSNSPTALIEVNEVTKRFGNGIATVTAVENVSFTVPSPQFLAIMGASGSGKSTLLHLLGGLTRPDEGSVSVNGTEITKLREPKLTYFRRQEIGIVFQAFNLVPTLTATDNVALPVLAGGKQGTQSVAELLELVGLTDRRDHRPDQLSGGEQQRVAIARGLVTGPPILLADEPTGNLDSVNGTRICELLQRLRREQERTVIAVTHEPEVAMWADRVLVLKDGGVVADFETGHFKNAQDLAAHYHELLHANDGEPALC